MIARMRILAKLVTSATTAAIHDVRTSVLALLKPDLSTGTMKPAVKNILMIASAVNIGTVIRQASVSASSLGMTVSILKTRLLTRRPDLETDLAGTIGVEYCVASKAHDYADCNPRDQ